MVRGIVRTHGYRTAYQVACEVRLPPLSFPSTRRPSVPYAFHMFGSAPKVFLSSTVRDLADLRSAIKFWLEDFGFQVLTSESPDFPHPLDRDAIAASLAPIAESDYYVLLVGSRVGTLVADEGISVTRAEFRYARESRRATGRPRMLHLVRADVDAARRLNRPVHDLSKADWAAIVRFLEEIEREEVKSDPNWLHIFSSFRDVVDVLRATLQVTGPLRRKALEANLKWEIVENTRELLHRTEKGLGVKANWLPKDKVPLGSTRDMEVWVDYPAADWIFMFRFALPRMATLTRSSLEEAINSGLFLDYESRAAAHVVGPLQRSLLELRRQMLRLDGLVESVNADEGVRRDVARCIEAAKQKQGTTIAQLTAIFLRAARDAMDNVLRLNRAIYCHLEGLEPALERPPLLPANPYGKQQPEKREDANRRETVTWLRLTAWPEQTTKRTPEDAGLATVDDAELLRNLDEMEEEGSPLV